jgi:hypothetical protein
MPLGLQIIGRADEDAALLGVAEWVWQHYASDADLKFLHHLPQSRPGTSNRKRH